MSRFKIGDVITGTGGTRQYSFTTDRATMKVVNLLSDDDIKVELIANPDYPSEVGNTYDVASEHFKLLTEGGAPMARRTFKLTKDTFELKKGALFQEACDDGDQEYVLLDKSFLAHDDFDTYFNGQHPSSSRKAVEESPSFFVEVFKVSPEYMTRPELDQFEAYKAAQTPKRGRKPKAFTANTTRTKAA